MSMHLLYLDSLVLPLLIDTGIGLAFNLYLIFLRQVATILNKGKGAKTVRDEDVGNYLADSIVELMGELNVPLGLKHLGYSSEGR